MEHTLVHPADAVSVQAGEAGAEAVPVPQARLVVQELSAANARAWDAYVTQSPHGLPQHLAGWRTVLERAYGYETRFVMAAEMQADETLQRVRGVLPLFVVRSPLLGRVVTTTPGGLCADDGEAEARLLAYGRQCAQEMGAHQFVIQDSRQSLAGFSTECAHEAWSLALADDREAAWKRLDRNIRRQVRMAERNGVTVKIDRSGACLADFYAVLSRFTHQAGTPVFGRRFLEEVIEAFPTGYNIVMAYDGARPIGGYFQLALGRTLYGAWGAALPEALALRPVYLAYWEIIADAVAHDFATLDMGRSPKDSNASKYKSQWGGVSAPVYQHLWPVGVRAPAHALSTQVQQEGRFQLFRQVWPKLPYSLTLWLGPLVRRHIPFA